MESRMLSPKAREYFEDKIYLPILITIITRDREHISGVKLKKTYINMFDKALRTDTESLKAHTWLHAAA